jgi:hypothetical protein
MLAGVVLGCSSQVACCLVGIAGSVLVWPLSEYQGDIGVQVVFGWSVGDRRLLMLSSQLEPSEWLPLPTPLVSSTVVAMPLLLAAAAT